MFKIYKEFSTSCTFLFGSDIFSWDFKKSSRIGYDSLFLRPVDDIRSILGEDQGRGQLSVKHEDVSWPDSLHMPSCNETSHFAEMAAAKEARSHYVPNAIQSIKTQRRQPGKHETDGREDFHARVAIWLHMKKSQGDLIGPILGSVCKWPDLWSLGRSLGI